MSRRRFFCFPRAANVFLGRFSHAALQPRTRCFNDDRCSRNDCFRSIYRKTLLRAALSDDGLSVVCSLIFFPTRSYNNYCNRRARITATTDRIAVTDNVTVSPAPYQLPETAVTATIIIARLISETRTTPSEFREKSSFIFTSSRTRFV